MYVCMYVVSNRVVMAHGGLMLIFIHIYVCMFVMKPTQEKIEKIDQRLRIQPLRGGNLLYIT